jgi:hypothetical protein
VEDAPEAPELAETGLVAGLLKDEPDVVAGGACLAGSPVRVDLDPQRQPFQERVRVQPLVSEPVGELDGVVEEPLGLGQTPRLHERAPEARQERGVRRIPLLEKGARALQEVDRGPKVAPGERAPTRDVETPRRLRRERPFRRADRPELLAVAVRLLEVVADDLVVLAVVAVEPVAEALVELRARRLRNARLRDVPEEDVAPVEVAPVASAGGQSEYRHSSLIWQLGAAIASSMQAPAPMNR